MDLDRLYLPSIITIFVFAVAAFFVLLKITAPYGRHHSRKFGPSIDARTSWVIMELPAIVLFTASFFAGTNALSFVPIVFFTLWQAHYIHRTLIFPFRMKLGGKTSSLLTTALAVVFNVLNGFNNGWALSRETSHYDASWLFDPRFIAGAALFVIGFVINRQSDAILRRLRGPGETGYKIPQGGLYRYVSCPNYLGELVEWSGWALATFNLAGLAFLTFSVANLLPRALSHHKWYKERFPDYPSDRRAIIPGVL